MTCFELVYPNGESVDTGDDVPHFPTEEQARENAHRFVSGPLGGVPVAQALPDPCHLIACANCDFLLDEDETILHFESVAEGLTAATEFWAWKVVGDKAYCPECRGQVAAP